ncbi:MAG: hypothetical protein MZW92_78550 [Comamonadaceae bacterium]|nr:hypothetical protein [Comamonadaceae bacterium]
MASAEARLASAEANLSRARQDVERYRPLLAEEAIARQVYDNAVADASARREAEVSASRAALDETRLGLEYAEVRAPLTGRIGAAQVFPGSLVTAGADRARPRSPPTTRPGSTSRSARRSCSTFERRTGGMETGRPTIRCAVVTADPERRLASIRCPVASTSATARSTRRPARYTLRAEFPNPDHRLTPGMFVARAREPPDELRECAGRARPRRAGASSASYFLTVVGDGDKAELRPVDAGPALREPPGDQLGPRRRRPRRRRGTAEGSAGHAAQGDAGDARGLRPPGGRSRPGRRRGRGEPGGASTWPASSSTGRSSRSVALAVHAADRHGLSLMRVLPVGAVSRTSRLPTVHRAGGLPRRQCRRSLEQSVAAPIEHADQRRRRTCCT